MATNSCLKEDTRLILSETPWKVCGFILSTFFETVLNIARGGSDFRRYVTLRFETSIREIAYDELSVCVI